MSVNEQMTAIADAIRDKTGGTEPLGLDAMASGVGEAYEAGLTEGREAERSDFWDRMQPDSPEKTDYSYAFYYWDMENFKPHKRIALMNGRSCFAFTYRSQGPNPYNSFDLAEILESLGVELITTPCTNASQLFYYSTVSRVPALDLQNATNVTGLFYSCSYLETVDEIQLPQKASVAQSSILSGCMALKNITFRGNIYTTINLQDSTLLTHDSLMGIINALLDYSTSASSTTYKLVIGSTNLAKLTEEEIQIIYNKGWDVV